VVEDGVGGDLFGEGLVGEHEAVAERIADDRVDVGGEHVVAAVEHGHGARGGNDADRAAR
jgi:hypothetical protein